jgi:hypothetical protein
MRLGLLEIVQGHAELLFAHVHAQVASVGPLLRGFNQQRARSAHGIAHDLALADLSEPSTQKRAHQNLLERHPLYAEAGGDALVVR